MDTETDVPEARAEQLISIERNASYMCYLHVYHIGLTGINWFGDKCNYLLVNTHIQ